VHQLAGYDRVKGISYWTKNYRTGIELEDPEALQRHHPVLRPDLNPSRGRASVVGQQVPLSERAVRDATKIRTTPLIRSIWLPNTVCAGQDR